MGVQGLTYLIVGLSFALYIGIALWTRAGSTKEFYVAGGGVHPVVNGMATAADWMSAASFISLAGIVSFVGYDGSVYLMGWTGGYVLLALCMAPYLRKFGKFTVPDFVGERYYSQAARTVAVICAIFICFTYIAGQMRGVGVVFSRFLEVEVDTGVYIGMAVVFFYAVLGGMKGITYTQVAQYCVLIFAFMVPAIFLSVMMTGHIIPQIGFGAGDILFLLLLAFYFPFLNYPFHYGFRYRRRRFSWLGFIETVVATKAGTHQSIVPDIDTVAVERRRKATDRMDQRRCIRYFSIG